MNPRRLHSDTIFSMSGFSFGSAIRTRSVRHGRSDVKVTAEASTHPHCRKTPEGRVTRVPNRSSIAEKSGTRVTRPSEQKVLRQSPAPGRLQPFINTLL